ncbi:MAG: 3-hydroxyacyl-ACP dehydratase FabZ [candidate division WOR-3 bacterium]|nr:3-hydroxyacyl-ACP dehydratase FabZ [candidate division WOR-3 bacterium]MDW7987523.1 3-hydroxyacyl-ACP dehydratase FabZ [candidate division WOR-3 bacterium]
MDYTVLKEIFSKPVLEIADIKQILPHRYPFLMIDRVVYLSENKIIATKAVSGNEEYFSGHFPNFPLMPGVLMIEAMAQTAGILLLYKITLNTPGNEEIKYLPLFYGINEARFKKMVMPGDILEISCETLTLKSKIAKIQGEIHFIRILNNQYVRELACNAQLLIGYQ